MDIEEVKVKNPKKVAAGKKGAEAKKLKADLKRKEAEQLKKENMELKIASERKEENNEKPITMDSVETEKLASEASNTKLLFLPIIGLGVFAGYQYFNTPKKEIVNCNSKSEKKKEIDPFDF